MQNSCSSSHLFICVTSLTVKVETLTAWRTYITMHSLIAHLKCFYDQHNSTLCNIATCCAITSYSLILNWVKQKQHLYLEGRLPNTHVKEQALLWVYGCFPLRYWTGNLLPSVGRTLFLTYSNPFLSLWKQCEDPQQCIYFVWQCAHIVWFIKWFGTLAVGVEPIVLFSWWFTWDSSPCSFLFVGFWNVIRIWS